MIEVTKALIFCWINRHFDMLVMAATGLAVRTGSSRKNRRLILPISEHLISHIVSGQSPPSAEGPENRKSPMSGNRSFTGHRMLGFIEECSSSIRLFNRKKSAKRTADGVNHRLQARIQPPPLPLRSQTRARARSSLNPNPFFSGVITRGPPLSHQRIGTPDRYPRGA